MPVGNTNFNADDFDDEELLDNVPAGILREYRDAYCTEALIKGCPELFLGTAWIKASQLRVFLRERGSSIRKPYIITSSPPPIPSRDLSPEPRVKTEVKPEPDFDFTIPSPKSRRGTPEVIEISSDEDEDQEAPATYKASKRRNMPDLHHVPTDWQDPAIQSRFEVGNQQVTARKFVMRVEYLDKIPALWPVPRIPTAYVMDMNDPQFTVIVGEKTLTLDGLIKDKDQDCWEGTTGSMIQGTPYVYLAALGPEPIKCRRSRLTCRGSFHCSEIDESLLDVERYELDPASRDAIVAAQAKTRTEEGTQPIDYVIAFYNLCQKSCPGVDHNGDRCPGTAMIRNKKMRAHRYLEIPDNVDTKLLAQVLKKGVFDITPEAGSKDCSRVISAHIGHKNKECPHSHYKNGKPVRGQIVRRMCEAFREIFVPVDEDIRFAVVLPDHTRPHNHPMPPAVKASHDVRQQYIKSVQAAGVLGATVKLIDNAPTTKALFGGKAPGLAHPSLQVGRLKRDLIRGQKIVTSPEGLGVPVEVDTTFKRAYGTLNEWEMVIWCAAASRLVTIARVYTDHTDTPHYKAIFDLFQEVVLELTNKPLAFKRLTPGGNLICLNVDMESAQVLGACQSLAATIDTEHSGLVSRAPEDIAPFILRLCYAHVKRPILDFKGLVSAAEFQRMMEFPYLSTQEELDEFSEWCLASPHDKIYNWWQHKIKNVWVLPAIIPFLSKITDSDWITTPSTTNAGEAQHHWTNQHTGTSLSIVEAVESTRVLDLKASNEIQQTLQTGIAINPHNDLLTRMGRGTQRTANAARKLRAASDRDAHAAQLQDELSAEKAQRKQSQQRSRALQAELAATRTTGKPKQRKPIVSSHAEDASSCGRPKKKRRLGGSDREAAQLDPSAVEVSTAVNPALPPPFDDITPHLNSLEYFLPSRSADDDDDDYDNMYKPQLSLHNGLDPYDDPIASGLDHFLNPFSTPTAPAIHSADAPLDLWTTFPLNNPADPGPSRHSYTMDVHRQGEPDVYSFKTSY
ncbi:hypothetical protein HWV62_16642 [Athelia sp. TMB]|nr:hypothetical protein HWV62_16642 [Athelia sp. TMB]